MHALSFYCTGLYIFSNTNFPIKGAKQIEKITIDLIFSSINTIISPPMQEAKIPALTNFQLIEEDEVSTSNKAHNSLSHNSLRFSYFIHKSIRYRIPSQMSH